MAKKPEEKKENELLTEVTEESTAEETTSAETETAVEELSEEEKAKAYWNERVPLMIPRDTMNPQDDEAVIVINGYPYQIQRGVQVMVPRKVFQAYMDSEAQKIKAFNLAKENKQEE